jgi:hypothetical protein
VTLSSALSVFFRRHRQEHFGLAHGRVGASRIDPEAFIEELLELTWNRMAGIAGMHEDMA